MAGETSLIARAVELVGQLARADVSGLGHDELLAAQAEVARLGRLADTLQARFSGEIARRSTPDAPGGGLARRQGFGNAGALVAAATGGSVAQARRSIDAGLAFASTSPSDGVAGGDVTLDTTSPRYPAVAQASLAGELSVDAAAVIVAGLESLADRMAAPEAADLERRLVGRAAGLPLADVRRMVSAAVARADVAAHREREQRQFEERFVSLTEDHTGMVTLSARLDPVTAAPIRTAIEQIVTHDLRARRDQDPAEADRRTAGQMRADALFTLCRHALGCAETAASGVRTTVIVRVDREDLEAGEGLATVDGVAAPVSVGQLRRLAGDAGVVPQVMGGPSEVLDLGRTQRLFSKAQRLALVERDGGCARCHAPPEHCEAHHIEWWDSGGTTDLANGVMLCTRCHHDVHRQGWEIVATPSRVEFIPPPDIDPSRTPRLGGRVALAA